MNELCESDKAFDFEDACDKWREKAREVFKGKILSIIHAIEHPNKKEYYVIDFEVKCMNCFGRQQFQWLVWEKGIKIA